MNQAISDLRQKIKNKEICVYGLPNSSTKLLYSPMARRAMWIDASALNDLLYTSVYPSHFEDIVVGLVDYKHISDYGTQMPEQNPLLTILPNHICNFKCSYCYSAQGRSSLALGKETIFKGIDFFIDSKTDATKELYISFMGGGEPLLSWDLLKDSIQYSQRKAQQRNITIYYTIITNGSVITEEMIDYIKKYELNISISFEILEEIQNLQRSQYDKVYGNIKRLISNSIIPQINSTITPSNVSKIGEMLTILETEFPQIKKMMFDTVTAPALFPKPKDLENFYNEYIKHFIPALQKAKQAGKSLTSFPYIRTVFPLDRACPGELCLTPDGFISGCYCISSSQDANYENSIYGKITESGFEYATEKYNALIMDNVYSDEKCKDCDVKWNCGGGCMYQMSVYDDKYKDRICNFTRQFVKQVVLNHFAYNYQQKTGKDITNSSYSVTKNYVTLDY